MPVARFAIRRSPANRDRATLTAIAVLLECGAGARYTATFKETASRRFRKNYWAIRLDGRRSPLPRKRLRPIPVSNLANLLSGSPSATSQQLVGNKGLQFGSFFHTPVSFSTVFQAQEFLRLQLPAIQWQLLPRGLDP